MYLLHLLGWAPVYAALLLALYAVGIQHLRGGAWHVLVVLLWLGLSLDVWLNFTLLALLTLDFPRAGEWTFSKRLQRLNRNPDWRGSVARAVTAARNHLDPTGQHIAP